VPDHPLDGDSTVDCRKPAGGADMPGPIRVLIVLDSGATFGPTDTTNNPGDNYFAVSEVVRSLQDAAEPLEFEVTKAHRGVDPLYPPGASVPPALLRFVADYNDYKLDAHDLTVYDQIWFFGIAVVDVVASTLSPSEIDAVFAFMQGGGGVFATGDHWDMGAALCGSIPRVRSMRRWFYGDAANRYTDAFYNNEGVDLGPLKGLSAPSALGPWRHDTTQPDIHGNFPFDAQSDAIPQPLRLVYAYGGNNVFTWRTTHPILCSAEGDIDTFPDHMHEGEVMEPLERDWANMVTYSGGTVAEYPSAAQGTAVVDSVTVPVVRPQIIAYGSVIPDHLTISSEAAHTGDPTYQTLADEFGTVCVYDGVPEGVGRIVTDATFHHFFDINLIGDPVASAEKLLGFQQLSGGTLVDGPMMHKMRTFFRNIAAWLARPASQKDVLARALDLVAAGHPFNEIAPAEAAYSDDVVWELGAQAVASLRRLQTMCSTITGISIWLYVIEYELPWPPPPPDPWWWRVLGGDPYAGVVNPAEVVQALLGGAVAELRSRSAKELRDPKNAQANLQAHIESGFRRGAKVLAKRLERRAKAYQSAAEAAEGGRAWARGAVALKR
ncbi:MAG: hypothetical protein JWO66_39, partial [Candidatus Eremiobacteraeota bacterium]|nr:hypothetical protein [Candidatus Eremiobacteraeota bacterium]